MADEPRKPNAPTVSQLRAEIDRGHMRDKVAAPDPAVAPLGTDDEAAGHPPGDDALRRAMAQRNIGGRPHRGRRFPTRPSVWLLVVAAVVLAVSLLAGFAETLALAGP